MSIARSSRLTTSCLTQFGQLAKSNSEMMIWEEVGKFDCNRFGGLCGIRSGLGNYDCALLIVRMTNHCLIVSYDLIFMKSVIF